MDREQLRHRADEDTLLYEKFASELESEHKGEFVAIARDGRLIVDRDQIRAIEKAIGEFGRGNFAFRKIGSRSLGRWRTRLAHQ